MMSGEFHEASEPAANSNLQMDKPRCVNYRDRNAGCRRCVQACPCGCIRWSDQGIELNVGACTACGTCTAACPTGALALRQPAPNDLRQAAKGLSKGKEQAVVISCGLVEEPLQDAGLATMQVPCLGVVDESLLAFMAGEGASKIYINISSCENCNLSVVQKTIGQTCDNANSIFEAWGSRTRVLMKKADGAERTPGSSPVTMPVAAPIEQAEPGRAKKAGLPKVGKDGTLPHAVPEKRSSLLEEIRSWIEPSGEMLETTLFGVAEIDRDLCRSCRMCTVFCPTGALSRVNGERYGIEHRADICLGCRCCQDICPTGAITISNQVPVSRIIEGDAVFFELEPMENVPSNPHQTLKAIKKMLGQKQIYER